VPKLPFDTMVSVPPLTGVVLLADPPLVVVLDELLLLLLDPQPAATATDANTTATAARRLESLCIPRSSKSEMEIPRREYDAFAGGELAECAAAGAEGG
jgi:hypothetical protein